MHFKHPEILWLLFLLAIPVIVHLFQLRRFKKVFFTNVAFLRELSIQTRKSSKLKKYLLLACRMLLLVALVTAFAQPFFPAPDSKNAGNDLFIVLDNSFSMQAKGQRGELLRRDIEDLLEHVPENRRFSLLTNDEDYWDVDIKSIRKDLQNLPYSATAFSPEAAAAKIKARPSVIGKDVIVMTDGNFPLQQSTALGQLHPDFVVSHPQRKDNVSIDTVALTQTRESFYDVDIKLTAYGNPPGTLPVALYDGGKLIAKTQAAFGQKQKTVRFTIPKGNFQGYAAIEDNSLSYDNTLYFSINKPDKIKVLAIGMPDRNAFLARIYTADEFDFRSVPLESLDYNIIRKQDAVIVNELQDIPQSLQATLKDFVEKGGNVTVIPDAKTPAQELSAFASSFGNTGFAPLQAGQKRITRIAFNHPLFAGVFEKKVENFQYPDAKASFGISGSAPAGLYFEDGSPFLVSWQNPLSEVYFFAAPISQENSNFKQSPLVVPTFYNMAARAGHTGIVSLTIGRKQPLIVDAALGKDEILSVRNSTSNFIPNQQALDTKVRLTFGESPREAGNYTVYNSAVPLQPVSFNYPRSESDPGQSADLSGDKTFGNVEMVFDDMLSGRSDDMLWKWLIWAALALALTELLIQKFVS